MPPLSLVSLEDRATPATGFTAFGAAAGGDPLVLVNRPNGSTLAQFAALDPGFGGGVRVAAGELDGDPNTIEVVAAAGPGGGPRVDVYRVQLMDGRSELLTSFFAFDAAFTGGVRVAVGNLTGAAGVRQQIVVGADAGGGPRVRTFDLVGGSAVPAAGPLADFFPYESALRGGVRVAVGEFDGNAADGDELAVGAGVGGGPRVKIYRADGAVIRDEFAFGLDPGFRGGVNVSVGNPVLGATLQTDGDLLDPSQRNTGLNDAAGVPPPAPAGGTNASGGTTGSNAGVIPTLAMAAPNLAGTVVNTVPNNLSPLASSVFANAIQANTGLNTLAVGGFTNVLPPNTSATNNNPFLGGNSSNAFLTMNPLTGGLVPVGFNTTAIGSV